MSTVVKKIYIKMTT